jgi:hypothetical protein
MATNNRRPTPGAAEFAGFMELTTPMRTPAVLGAENAMDIVGNTGQQQYHQLQQQQQPGAVPGGGMFGYDQQQQQMMMMMMNNNNNQYGNNNTNMEFDTNTKSVGNKLSSSTSTIYVRNSHPANPDSAEVLSAIASVLHVIMSQSHTGNDIAPPIDMNLAVFDERCYVPKEMRKKLRWGNFFFRGNRSSSSTRSPANVTNEEPNQEGVPPKEVILEFLSLASKRASFSAETTIIALILINRLLSTTTYKVHTFNWRLLWLCALLLAQKLQDDVSLDNASFIVVWRYATKIDNDTLTVSHFNEMEAKFLQMLNFAIFIPRSLFAQFLFELRTLYEAEQPTLEFPLQPLSAEKAAKLESQTSQSRVDDFKKRYAAGTSGMEGTQGFTMGVSGGGRGRHVLS